MNVLIIEDEAKTAKELKGMIQRLDDALTVVDIIPSVKAAIQWLQKNPPPQLILSDIQLADGLSFEIFRAVETGCPVIFCTAFDEYAIQAFETIGIDYLLKPVDEDKLAGSLRKYARMKQFLAGQAADPRLATLMTQLQPVYKSGLLVFRNEKIIPVKTADIAFIYSAGGLVTLYTKGNHTYTTREVLDELELQLDPKLFFRANRQFLINRNNLLMAEHYFNRRLVVKLDVNPPERIVVSKIKAPELLAWMEG